LTTAGALIHFAEPAAAIVRFSMQHDKKYIYLVGGFNPS